MTITFFITNILLGVGLAMDAFSVSLANGLADHSMKRHRMLLMAGTFAFFQALMPFTGWLCVHTLAEQFEVFSKFIPFIALALLSFIGGKMLIEGIKACREGCEECAEVAARLSLGALLVQGVATSIDALSSGFAIEVPIAEWYNSVICCGIIGVVTFGICVAGLILGKKFGTSLAGKASVLGGSILIIIGLWIFVKGVFF